MRLMMPSALAAPPTSLGVGDEGEPRPTANLQKLVVASIAPVCHRIGEMLRTSNSTATCASMHSRSTSSVPRPSKGIGKLTLTWKWGQGRD